MARLRAMIICKRCCVHHRRVSLIFVLLFNLLFAPFSRDRICVPLVVYGIVGTEVEGCQGSEAERVRRSIGITVEPQ